MDEFTGRKIIKDMEFVKKSLANIDKTLALQHQSLEIHIKRSDLLEQKLQPVEEHVASVKTVLRIMGWIGASGIVAVIVQYILSR